MPRIRQVNYVLRPSFIQLILRYDKAEVTVGQQRGYTQLMYTTVHCTRSELIQQLTNFSNIYISFPFEEFYKPFKKNGKCAVSD